MHIFVEKLQKKDLKLGNKCTVFEFEKLQIQVV
jgi:hypothetical protein